MTASTDARPPPPASAARLRCLGGLGSAPGRPRRSAGPRPAPTARRRRAARPRSRPTAHARGATAGVCTNDARLGTTQRAHGQHHRRGDHAGPAGAEGLGAVAQAAGDEGQPETSSRLARIEPTIAAWTTVIRPWRRAKMPMNSSGRLPSALCRTPVAPGAEPVRDLVDGRPDQQGEHGDGGAGHDERRDLAEVDVVGDAGGQAQRRADGEHPHVGEREGSVASGGHGRRS